MAMFGHFLRVPRIGFLTRREGRRYRSNCLRISGISLQFGGMMHNNMKQIAIERGGHAWPILRIPRNFEILQNMLAPGQRDDVTVLTFQGFQKSAWNLMRWCTVPWSRSLLKMAMLGQYLGVPRHFSMIGLGQEDEIEEITLRPEIWWHDVVHHEADHCMKWPYSASVCIFWSRPAEGVVVLWTSCFDHVSLNQQRNKQSSRRWFETP